MCKRLAIKDVRSDDLDQKTVSSKSGVLTADVENNENMSYQGNVSDKDSRHLQKEHAGRKNERNGQKYTRKVLEEKDGNFTCAVPLGAEKKAAREVVLSDEEHMFYDLMMADAQEDVTMEYAYSPHFFEKFKEQKIDVNRNYMVYQQELTWRTRTILIDWLVDVHWQLGLLPETLFLAVNTIDRFLSLRTVSKNKLQLVGVTALMIASKYEEVECPPMSTFKLLINCDMPDLINAERYLLMALNFNLNFLSPLCFLRRLSMVDNYEIRTRTLAKYILEQTLLYEHFISYNSQIKATASFYLARKILETSQFTNLFFFLAQVERRDIKKCVNDMLVMLSRPVKYDSVKRKYATEKMLKVSAFVEEFRVKHLVKYCVQNQIDK